jgi:hypothetical protein
MPRKVIIGNISAAAGSNISLRGKIPAPIYVVRSAVVLAGHSVNEGGSATYDILAATSATPTKVDEWTITLNVAITTKDLLELEYIAVTDYPVPT